MFKRKLKAVAALLLAVAVAAVPAVPVKAEGYTVTYAANEAGRTAEMLHIPNTLNAGDTLTVDTNNNQQGQNMRLSISYMGPDGEYWGKDVKTTDMIPGDGTFTVTSIIREIEDNTVWTVLIKEYSLAQLDTGATIHSVSLTLKAQSDDTYSTPTGRQTYDPKPAIWGEVYDVPILATLPGDPVNKIVVVDGALPPGLRVDIYDEGTRVSITGTPTEPGDYTFTVEASFADGTSLKTTTHLVVLIDKNSDKNGGKKKSSSGSTDKTPAAKTNPDAIVINYYLNQADYAAHRRDYKAEFGKQTQGPACQAAFKASVPPGWYQAFTFSMSYEKKNTTTLKDGIIEVYVPHDYIKAGRSYALMAMDKSGIVKIYYDTDTYPYVFTSPLNVEGYAFALLTKD